MVLVVVMIRCTLASKNSTNMILVMILILMVSFSDSQQPSPFNIELDLPLTIEPMMTKPPVQLTTVAAHRYGDVSRIFFGASTTRSSKDNLISGTVFQCEYSSKKQSICTQIQPQKGSHIVEDGKTRKHQYQPRNQSLFGHTVHIEPDGTVIVCAPNWVTPVLNSPEGVCFAFDFNTNVSGKYQQRSVFKFRTTELTLNNRPKESHTLFGFSMAHYRNERLLFGMPGYYDFCGTWVELNTDGGRFSQMAFESRNRSRANSYIGYSVTYYKPEIIVVAAPRLENFRGKVELINPRNLAVLLTFHSHNDTFGEFFGSSVLVADTQNDGVPEILIGAPLYSAGRIRQQREIGRVYLFGDIEGRLQNLDSSPPVIITAETRKPSARFGTHLAAIDLDLDQYEDVIIGAPFEENEDDSSTGAIYLYYGSPTGLMLANVRRIGVESISPVQVKGFGFTFWTGTDLDGNGYPDLVIPALNGGKAFVLRSKPIIHIDTTVTFHPAAINFSASNHECGSTAGHFCFNVSYCIVLRSPLFEFTRHQLSFFVQMTVPDRNLVIKENRVMSDHWNRTVKAVSDKICRREHSFTVQLKRKEDIFDIITPIQVQLEIQLLDQKSNLSEFCADCPVADPVTITDEIGFEHGCASQKCLSRLMLDVEVKYGTELAVDRLVEGQAISLDIAATIRNEGESSINTKLIVATKPGLNMVPGYDSSRCVQDEQNGHYRCEVSKLMVANQGEKMIIHMDISGTDSKYLWLELNATTSSQIEDGSRIHFAKNFTIIKEANFTMNLKTVETEHNFTHLVQRVLFPVSILVEKIGPSTITGAYIEFEVPPAVEIEQPFQYGCTKVKQGPKRFTKIDIVNETLQMSCPSEQCSRYRCNVGRFESGTAVNRPVSLDITLSFKAFRINENIKYTIARLETPFRLYINDSFFDSKMIANEIVPLFVFYKLDTGGIGSLKHQNLIMFGSAGLGILIIILTTIILIKYGFFKRRKSDQLKKMHQRMSMAPNMVPLPIANDEGQVTEINQIGFS